MSICLRRTRIAIQVLLVVLSSAAAQAGNSSFHFAALNDSCDGTPNWQGTHATGACSGESFSVVFSADLSGGGIDVVATLTGASFQTRSCPARGSLLPAYGVVSVDLEVLCGSGTQNAQLTLDTSAGNPSQETTGEAATAGTNSAAAPVAAAEPVAGQIEPINQIYVAVKPAKVRQKPDVTSARVKTLGVGNKIYVLGKLEGQDWYAVSQNGQPLGYVVADQLVPESEYKPTASLASVTPAPTTAPVQPGIPPALAGIDFGRYEALVIGNNVYANGIPALGTAASDAQAVAATLRDSYGFTVKLLLNATRAQIIGALARYRETLTEDDNLLIYYAGHGSYDQSADQGYWLPVDAAPDDPTNWVSNTDLTTMLKAMQARHVMIVADSCYSGTLTRDANVSIQDAGYIQRMVQKKARTVMTSGGLEPVSDAGGSGHSVFALAFIAALQRNTGVMDAESFFAKVREPVVLAAPQTPEYSNLRFAGHEGGDFIFVRR